MSHRIQQYTEGMEAVSIFIWMQMKYLVRNLIDNSKSLCMMTELQGNTHMG